MVEPDGADATIAAAAAPRLVAVATTDWQCVAGHAGRARRWLVFAVDGSGSAAELRRVELAPDQVFHHHEDGPHPLDGVEVVIAASAGEGFVAHLGKRGIAVALTARTDARQAAVDCTTGTPSPPRRRGLAALVCKVRDAFSRHR